MPGADESYPWFGHGQPPTERSMRGFALPMRRIAEPSVAAADLAESGVQHAPSSGCGKGRRIWDHLPQKQGLARGRPLATYVRCDAGWGVERETGIEPV